MAEPSKRPDAEAGEPLERESKSTEVADDAEPDAGAAPPEAEAADEGEAADEEPPRVFPEGAQGSIFRVLLLLLLGSAIILGMVTWADTSQRRDDIESAERTVSRNAAVCVDFFASRIALWKQATLAAGRAAVINESAPDVQDRQLQAVLGSVIGADEVTVVWGNAPAIHQLDATKLGDTIATTRSDLTAPPAWYAGGLAEEHWENPFVATLRGREHIAVAYVTPVRTIDKGPVVGVARLVLPVNQLRDVLNAQSLGRVGFGMIIARDGRFVAHPFESFMLQGKRVLEVAQEEGGAAGGCLRDAAEQAMQGKTGLIMRPDPLSGQPCWLVYAPVPNSTWIAMYNVYTEEFLPIASVYRRHWIDQTTWSCITAFFALLLLLKVHRGTDRRLWAGAISFTVLCVIEMAVIWSSTLDQSVTLAAGGAIMGRATLHKLQSTYDRAALAAGVPKPCYIPTGVYLQSITIGTSGNAVVSGFVWQKYSDAIPPDLQRGVMFPDDDKTTTLLEKGATYVRRDGDRTTIGWTFRVDLRESFFYEKYPFDRQDVAIRIWPVDFDRNVVLVPDVEAYQTLSPLTRPGLDTRFGVSGFDAISSCFTFVDSTTTTNFGIPSYMGQNAFPDLQYNTVLRRQWMGPMLSNLFPLLMVLFTVFVNLMSFTKDDKPWGLYGTIAGLFFTSLLAHLKMRDIFSVHVINYLEYFYGVTYLMIVLVAVNSYLVHARPDHHLLRFRKGMINRLAFWPLVGLLLLTVTYAIFY